MRLSLRWKIVGGFGLLLLLIALLGWVTLSLFGSLRNVQRRVFDEAIPALLAVDEIVRSYTAQSTPAAQRKEDGRPEKKGRTSGAGAGFHPAVPRHPA